MSSRTRLYGGTYVKLKMSNRIRLYGGTYVKLKMSSRTRLYGGTYVILKDITPVIRNQWGEKIQNFKVFGLLRDCQIYRGPIRLVRKIRVGEILKQRNQLRILQRTRQKFSIVVGGRRAYASLQI